MKWLIKKVDDKWTPQCRTKSLARPRGDYLLVSGVKTKFPKVVISEDDIYKVVEDVEAAEACEADQLIEEEMKNESKLIMKEYTSLVDEINSLEDVKVKSILLKILKCTKHTVSVSLNESKTKVVLK